MVQISLIAIVLTSALTSLVVADNCNTGLMYCGSTLFAKGNYATQVNTGLKSEGLSTSFQYQRQSLWACTANGGISFDEYCKEGCMDGGSGKDDYCVTEAGSDADTASATQAEGASETDSVAKRWAA